MHRSNKRHRLALILLLSIFGCTAGAVAQDPPQQAPQAAQSSNAQASGDQQPVGDLTPPSDAEAEQLAKQQAAQQAAQQQANASTNIPNVNKGKGGNDEYVFRKDVEEVTLYATVMDAHNRPVTDLGQNAFAVYEDNQPQTITSFRREDVPISLGLLIDNSGSMLDKRPRVNLAALNLVRASNSKDEVFLVNFNDQPYLDQDFTSNVDKLKEALQKVEARGGTALYDAVIASSDHLSKEGRREKKAIVVITDGEDDASTKSLEEAVRAVQAEQGPTVYTIGILGDDTDRERKRARRALERLAFETGGMAFFPKDLDEVDQVSNEVAKDIRNQYSIGYKPSRPQTQGGFRTVRVEAKEGKTHLQVRTRSGYFAGQKKAQNQPPPNPAKR